MPTHNTQTLRDPRYRDPQYTNCLGPTRRNGRTNRLSFADFPSHVLTNVYTHRHAAQSTCIGSTVTASFKEKPTHSRCPQRWQAGHTASLGAPGQGLPSLSKAKHFLFGPKVPTALSLSLGSWDGTSAALLNLPVRTLEVQELDFLAPKPRSFLG